MKTNIHKTERILLGAHFSIAKGLDRAVYDAAGYGCTALQIFTKNASTWKERTVSREEILAFEKAKTQTGITRIASHAAYLLNLASPEPKKYRMSVAALTRELERCAALDLPFLILHPGNHMGAGEAEGIKRIASGINTVFDEVKAPRTQLLLETTAGQGSSVGGRFEHIRSIMEGITDSKGVGACLDTSHIFAAGYDIRTRETYEKTLDAFDEIIGLDRLAVIHLNDAKRGLGSGVDRHEHIGRGQIGLDAFRFIMQDPRFEGIPKIIETPKNEGDTDYDRINLDRLRSLLKD
ncbi:MAG: deoxyribonuclease IV [Deltaproteobacteria bacterium]|nr:deoxyribonuclease IV [Deltaproteobacteria bacterium]MBW2133251.1 deoxyribonuclease IV [Deltaproteobacteria bacterium]